MLLPTYTHESTLSALCTNKRNDGGRIGSFAAGLKSEDNNELLYLHRLSMCVGYTHIYIYKHIYLYVMKHPAFQGM